MPMRSLGRCGEGETQLGRQIAVLCGLPQLEIQVLVERLPMDLLAQGNRLDLDGG